VLDFLAVGAFDGDFCAARFETQERAHAEKCIASDFFSAFDGFEQEGVGLAFGYSEEGGDRVSRSAEIDFTTGTSVASRERRRNSL